VRSCVLGCAALAIATILATASLGRPSEAASAAIASAPTVPVYVCHTVTAGAPGQVPDRLRVLGAPASTAGLVAYTNSSVVVIGPPRMDCTGSVAADGGSELTVWPRNQRRPRRHSRGDGLTLTVDPACVACQAQDVCPFFTSLARNLGFPCTSRVPAGERVAHHDPHLTLFRDPPGVAGDGWPSGGRDPANGLVGVRGSLRAGRAARLVVRATCTLPARSAAICTASLNDAISRYG
jgi:hypothetical protein